MTSQYGGADFLENCDRLKIENKAKAAAGIAAKNPTPEKENNEEENQD